MVGRDDFLVRSLHLASGVETWNATFSRLVRLRRPREAQGDGGGPLVGGRLIQHNVLHLPVSSMLKQDTISDTKT